MARMEHVAIYGDDTVALKDFYCRCFGMKVLVETGDKPPAYFLADDVGMALEIIGRPAGFQTVDQRYVCHLAFWVDSFETEMARLLAAGVTFEPPAVDKERKIAFFHDPAGNRAQLVWRAKKLGA